MATNMYKQRCHCCKENVPAGMGTRQQGISGDNDEYSWRVYCSACWKVETEINLLKLNKQTGKSEVIDSPYGHILVF